MGILSTISRKVAKSFGSKPDAPKLDAPEAPVSPSGDPAIDPMEAELKAYQEAPQEPHDPIQEFGAAGEYGPQGPGGRTEERNINLDHFSDPKVKAFIEQLNAMEQGFRDQPHRQVVTNEESISKSTGVIEGYTERRKEYAKIVGKVADNRLLPEDVISTGQMVNETAEEIRDEAMRLKGIRNSGAEVSADDMAHFSLLVQSHVRAQEVFSGIASSSGRNMQAFNAIKNNENDLNYSTKEFKNFLKKQKES